MWAKHCVMLPAPTDGWKKPHGDSYYRKAIGMPRANTSP